MELETLLTELGFADVRETARFDTFGGTSVERVARKYSVHGANVFARWPRSVA